MPSSARWSATALRTSSPAPTSSTSEKVASATTSASRKRCPADPLPPRPASFKTPSTSGREAWMAGTKPKQRPVAAVSTTANAITRPSRVNELGSTPAGARLTKSARPQWPTSKPSVPPITARNAPSGRSWRKSLPARDPLLVREIGDREEHVATHDPAVGGSVAAVELGPEDTHDRVDLAVEHQAAAEDPRVRSEAPLPETVAEHGHRPRGGGVRLFGGERAAEGRPRAEQREEAVAHEGPHDALGLGAAGQVHALAPPRRHVRERVILLAPVHELPPGGGGLRPAPR